MKLADVYREWKANGTVYGGVGRNGISEYVHITQLGLWAIEELEQEAELLRGKPMQPTYKLNPRLPEGLTDGMVFGGHLPNRELTPEEIEKLNNPR